LRSKCGRLFCIATCILFLAIVRIKLHYNSAVVISTKKTFSNCIHFLSKFQFTNHSASYWATSLNWHNNLVVLRNSTGNLNHLSWKANWKFASKYVDVRRQPRQIRHVRMFKGSTNHWQQCYDQSLKIYGSIIWIHHVVVCKQLGNVILKDLIGS
jgi:hypothetical protein